MSKFLRKYSELFFFIPLWYIAGGIFEPAGYLIAFPTMLYWYSRKKHHFFIIAFFFVLLMADSRVSGASFAANLRIPVLFFLMFFAIEALYRGNYGIKKIFFPFLPFFIISVISLWGSPVLAMGIAKTVSYFCLIFIVLHYFPYVIRKTGTEVLFDVIYFVTLMISLSFVMMPIFPDVVFWRAGTPHQTFKSFFANPNGLGLYTTLTTPFMFILSHIFPQKKRLLYYSTGILFLSAILAESRTSIVSIIGFFGLYFFYVYFRDKRHPRRARIGRWATRFLWIICIPSFILIITSFGVVGLIEAVGLGETLEVQTIESGAGRFVAWEHALEEIEKNPWQGKGFHYDVHMFRGLQKVLQKMGHSGGTHNSYLSFLIDFGIPGLFFFLFFIFKLFNSIKGDARNFIVPYVTICFFSSNFEAWLASSINYVTIFFYLTVILLIHFDTFKEDFIKSKMLYSEPKTSIED